jgi:hypothetical protein
MRKALLAAFAAAAILAMAAPVNRARAMTLAAPSQLGLATADAGLVQQAAWRCGWRGCVPGWHRYYWSYPYPYPFPYFVIPRIPIWIRPPWPGPWFRPAWGWRYRYHHWRHR